MTKTALVLALAVSAAFAQAYSFAGGWDFDSDATLNYNTAFGSGTRNNIVANPVAVTQSSLNEFAFPVDVGGAAGNGDFVVSGLTVTDINSGGTTDPFDVMLGAATVSVRLTYPTWNLTGTIDGINSGLTDGFGARAYHITGDSVTISNVKIEALIGTWVDLGTNNTIVVNSWSLEREAVPEPATLAVLALAALAVKRRKR